MDSQEVLEALASLRQNLEAIDSAKKQVQSNVAAYESVRQQLSDTSQSVKDIVHNLETIFQNMEANNFSISSKIEEEATKILESIKAQARSAEEECNNISKYLDHTMTEFDKAIAMSADQSVTKIDEALTRAIARLKSDAESSQNSFKTESQSCLQELKHQVEGFQTTSSKMIEDNRSAIAKQLAKLADTVDRHLVEYSNLNSTLKGHIDSFQQTNDNLGKRVNELNDAINSLIKKIGDKIDSNQSETSNTLSQVRGEIQSNQSKTDNTLSQIRGEIRSADKEVSEFRKESEGRYEEMKKQVKTNKTMMIITMVLVVISIIVNFIR